MTKVFIDGKDGTTGLKIYERFENRDDIELLLIDEHLRKDVSKRKELINNADVCFLCLPDQAAKESVSLIENENTKVIDTSTAHRTNPQWAYGFPELSQEHRNKIINSNKIAVPGCHASGFNSIVYPLTECELMPKDYPIVCFSITGYSGGGKKMIADYNNNERSTELLSPRQYGLFQNHKHLPEIIDQNKLSISPIFNPIVADYYSGMVVTVPIYTKLLNKKVSKDYIHKLFSEKYNSSNFIKVLPLNWEAENGNMIGSNNMSGKDSMEILITGNDDKVVIASRFDNLGKGASGAAIQCMNIVLGINETYGLNL